MFKEKLSCAKEKLCLGISSLRRGFVNFLSRRDPAEYFVALLILGLLVFVIRCIIGGSETFTEIFHLGCDDQYMDFFNSLRDVSLGSEVYSVRRVIYPPLANALLWLISRIIPEAYLATPTVEEAFAEWRFYPATTLALFLFLILSLVSLALILNREKYPPVLRNLLSFFTVASFPVIFLVERGNVVILCLLALLVYAQNYNSESRAGREVALWMLAVAAALKVYPALFGLVLLKDKRYRDALRAAIYALILFLVPSFFFGGPFFCAKWIVLNTLNYSNIAGGGVISDINAASNSELLGKIVLYSLYLLAVLFLVFYSLVQKKIFKTWMLTGTVLLCIPSIFSAYNWVLLMPALITFLRTEKLRGINWLYFFCMTLPFYVYLPKPWQDDPIITLMAIMIASCVIEGVILFVKFFKDRKKAKIEVKEPPA